MEDMLKRLEIVENWLREGPPNSFWISGMFFPQGFMTAAMQTYARAKGIAIDELRFMTIPTNVLDPGSLTEPPTSGVNLHGLFLQGCGWNLPDMHLEESLKGVLFVPMPVIWLKPLFNTEYAAETKGKKLYDCPMYKTSERRGVLSTTVLRTVCLENKILSILVMIPVVPKK